MKLYANAAGELIRFLQDDDEERRYPDPPAGAAGVLEFDPASNPGIREAIQQDWNGHLLLGGQLTRNGVQVQINPPTASFTDRRRVASMGQDLKAYLAASSPTGAQTVAALKILIRLTLVIGRAVLHLTEDL
jgi:hypothetical protein